MWEQWNERIRTLADEATELHEKLTSLLIIEDNDKPTNMMDSTEARRRRQSAQLIPGEDQAEDAKSVISQPVSVMDLVRNDDSQSDSIVSIHTRGSVSTRKNNRLTGTTNSSVVSNNSVEIIGATISNNNNPKTNNKGKRVNTVNKNNNKGKRVNTGNKGKRKGKKNK